MRGRLMNNGALAAWAKRGETAPLEHWLEGLLDCEGVPRRMEVGQWPELLLALDQARRMRYEPWPERLDAGIEGLLRAMLRFARTSGTMVFSPPGARPADALVEALKGWARRLSDPGLATVLDWRHPGRSASRLRSHAAPPLPAWSSPTHPLAMLRANWSPQGDFLAIDHRREGPASLLELTGLGRAWLGPSWVAELGLEDAHATRPRPSHWVSNSSADLLEWTFRLGATRLTRSALLCRGRNLALLADQVEGRGQEIGSRITLPEGVRAVPLEGGPGWLLTQRRGAPKAQVIPLGLSRRNAGSSLGTLAHEQGELRLRQYAVAQRCWLPLLVSWDPIRNRRLVRWKSLTVAEQSRICSPETAFAARITWGRTPGDTLLVYRSLARPALRSVLGHQTRARFLVALFRPDGDIVPIIKLD
jgi:hypothetical protein